MVNKCDHSKIDSGECPVCNKLIVEGSTFDEWWSGFSLIIKTHNTKSKLTHNTKSK